MFKSLPRIFSAIRYLKMMDPFYKWRIKKFYCYNCGNNFFIQLKNTYDTKSKNLSVLGFSFRCIKCKANLTNISIIPVIKKHLSDYKVSNAWEMSTYGATLNYLQKSVPKVFASEYVEGIDSGTYLDNVLIEDAQNSSFQNEEIDLITCNQVFEHVADLDKALKESFRILSKNGALIFSVPFFDIPNTIQKAYIENGNINFIGKPEFHDSRLSGPYSAPVFWHVSINEISEKLTNIGFEVEIINIGPDKESYSQVIYAKKIL